MLSNSNKFWKEKQKGLSDKKSISAYRYFKQRLGFKENILSSNDLLTINMALFIFTTYNSTFANDQIP